MPARFVINFTKCTNGVAASAPWVAVSDSLAGKHWQQADQWHPAEISTARLRRIAGGNPHPGPLPVREREEDALAASWPVARVEFGRPLAKAIALAALDQRHPRNGKTG